MTTLLTPTVSVTPACRHHLGWAGEALVRIRATEPEFPPASVDGGLPAVDRPGLFTDWLTSSTPLARWVGSVDGTPAGHIQVSRLHDYLVRFLGPDAVRCVEVGRLFVDPLHAGHGVGAALLHEATGFAHRIGKRPVLAVLSVSTAAIRLYRSSGWQELGRFDGIQGTNLVMAPATARM